MKRVINSVRAAEALSPHFGMMLLSYAILPFTALACFGLYSVLAQGFLIELVVIILVLSGVPAIAVAINRFRCKRRMKEEITESAEGFVKPSADWGQGDNDIWQRLNCQIEEQLKEKSDWADLYDHSLELVSKSATEYGKTEWSFSVPEILKVCEEVSRRYRLILQQHAPMVEKLSCSTIKYFYDKQDQVNNTIVLGKVFYDAYRSYRIFTPTGLTSEIRGKILSAIFKPVGNNLILNLKKALLQEVLSVAIDLYSGRFRIDEQDLQSTQAAIEDHNRMAQPLDPLRVCLLGQVSSGKSSVINALKKEVAAEIDNLPSTDQATVYQCSVDGVDLLHLVDLPGLDGNSKIEEVLLKHITQANVVLWVLKANQPARALDSAFKARLDDWYAKPENRSKKKPVIIGVLNQVDRLKPFAEWNPPYSLDDNQSAKVTNINEALSYNQELLGLNNILPLSVSEQRQHFNLCVLENTLFDHLQEGLQVQLNQRRNEAGKDINLQQQLERTKKLLIKSLKLAFTKK